MEEGIHLEIVGREARLTINRPGSGNALRMKDIAEAKQAVQTVAAIGDVRILRVQSVGDIFCSGRAPESGSGELQTGETIRNALVQPILDLYRAFYELDVVTLAQVQGPAHGLGCALVACCDLAIGTKNARFTLPEMHKNLPPTLAMSAVYSRINRKSVAHLVLAADELDGEGALRVGLLGELVEPEELQARSDEVVSHVCGRNTLALQTVKRYFRTVSDGSQRTLADAAASLLSSAMSDIQRQNAG